MYRKSRDSSAPQGETQKPPVLAERLLLLFSPVDEGEALAGDLAEEFQRHHLPLLGRSAARRWYWGQVLRSLLPGLSRPAASRSPEGASEVEARTLPHRIPATGHRGSISVDPWHHLTHRRIRARKGDGLMSDLLQDIKFALRTLRQSPTFSVVTILTLALAIGVNCAIFSILNLMFFSDVVPIRDGDTLGFVFMRNPERGIERRDISIPDFLDIREGVTAFEDMGGTTREPAILTGADEPARVVIAPSTANLFDLWGIQPVLGRGFREGEDLPGADRVAILSHGTWERRFSADPGAIGRTISLNGYPTTVVGVMGEEMEVGGLGEIEVWVPVVLDRDSASRDDRMLWVTGKLAPGATLDQARAEVAAVVARLRDEYPDSNAGWYEYVATYNEGLSGTEFNVILSMLTVTVAFVLLIACSNVATLMLARASARGREIAVRAALGAGRMRIVRQLLTEGAMLSLAAGLVGLIVMKGTLASLGFMARNNAEMSNVVRLLGVDRNVLLFTLSVSLLAPLLFGLLPALRASRGQLVDTLKEAGGRSIGGRGAMKGRRFLVAGQVALALGLMIVAGLLIESMIEMRRTELGYDANAILTMRVDLPEGEYEDLQQQQQFFRDVMDGVRGLPIVESAAWVSRLPLAEGSATSSFEVLGRPQEDPERRPFAGVVIAEPEYFDVMELSVIRGRGFQPDDTAERVPVAVVNQDAVDRFWPGEMPIGEHIRLGESAVDAEWVEIVGVVENLVYPEPEDPFYPLVYLPLEQRPRSGLGLVLRPRGDVKTAASPVREQIWAVDPNQPVSDVQTMDEVFAERVAVFDPIFGLFMIFAFFALLMAAAGIYGVISFAVGQRTREFGIRMALGAEGRNVRSMVMRSSVWLVGAGALGGLILGFTLARVLASGLDGVGGMNPASYLLVTAVLVVAAALSAYFPARRATRVDPMVALRTE
jgi:putative ABC transport system permease protein